MVSVVTLVGSQHVVGAVKGRLAIDVLHCYVVELVGISELLAHTLLPSEVLVGVSEGRLPPVIV